MRFALMLAVCVLLPTAALGGTVTITGSGTWNSTIVSSTGLSAPDATWSFSIEVASPVDPSLTESVTNASYSLNGTPVSDTILSVSFFPGGAPLYGGLDLNFPNLESLVIAGPQLYDTTTLNLIPGTYNVTIDDVGADTFVGPPDGEGSGTVTITLASIPEPTSLVSGGIALASLAGLELVRRRRSAA